MNKPMANPIPKRPLVLRLRAKLRHVRLQPFSISLPYVAYQNMHLGLVKLQLYCGQLLMCLGAKVVVQPEAKWRLLQVTQFMWRP